MTEKFFPEALYEAGFTDLVSVIPPGAQLTPTSKIPPAHVGKVPGRRLGNGLWAGYDWRKHQPSVDDVRQWCIDGANIGMRADRFPGVDIDCTDETLAQIIEDAAVAFLGAAPLRYGKRPKRLLVYRTAEKFGRMRLWIKKDGVDHLVEILGDGQQYLLHGIHPSTQMPYEWHGDLVATTAAGLTEISRDKASAFLDHLSQLIDMLGVAHLEREGDGKPITRSSGDQLGLRAPSIDLVREAVSKIPNTNSLFPDRTSYLRIGYAIRAACGEENADEAFPIFAEWASRWEGNGRVNGNDPETVLADWRRMKGDKSVGWSFLAEQARGFGFEDATLDFDALDDAPREENEAPTIYSDQWLAERVVQNRRGELRYVPQSGRWLVWNAGRWQQDAELLAEDIVKQELKKIAAMVERQGSTPKEQKESLALAQRICSGAKADTVRKLMQSDRAVAVSLQALDHDSMVLNTPGGIVDLKQGKILPADPDALCSKSTTVPCDFNGAMPEWKRFLAEATGGDRELEAYLQRVAGYCLTGETIEQSLLFIHGPGGNGKSVFVNVLSGILGDYARVATMDTFTASNSEKHSTDIAMLVGARLVTASETEAGKRWDEAKVKSLTGGEPVTARFMRQDNFTFTPNFKLLFIGNHRPEVRNVDEAMRRRIQIVPFTVTPARVDKHLPAKLREEYPAILAWMVEGCLEWQKKGLQPPQSVLATTQDYFESEDAIGRWMKECIELDPTSSESTLDLFASWREWANQNGEYVGSAKRFAAGLIARKMERTRDSETRRMGFRGIAIKNRHELGIL